MWNVGEHYSKLVDHPPWTLLRTGMLLVALNTAYRSVRTRLCLLSSHREATPDDAHIISTFATYAQVQITIFGIWQKVLLYGTTVNICCCMFQISSDGYGRSVVINADLPIDNYRHRRVTERCEMRRQMSYLNRDSSPWVGCRSSNSTTSPQATFTFCLQGVTILGQPYAPHLIATLVLLYLLRSVRLSPSSTTASNIWSFAPSSQ